MKTAPAARRFQSGRVKNVVLTVTPPEGESRGTAFVAGRLGGEWMVTAHDDTWASFPIGRFARLRDALPACAAHRFNA
jgi:hypothetical protein